ncbi:hypothetical protein F5Y10DRAFT_263711 [Nemania abortiva]|nr:hypothetical protein F5Y10DRAFT_263711 [Nemania abortiva]
MSTNNNELSDRAIEQLREYLQVLKRLKAKVEDDTKEIKELLDRSDKRMQELVAAHPQAARLYQDEPPTSNDRLFNSLQALNFELEQRISDTERMLGKPEEVLGSS